MKATEKHSTGLVEREAIALDATNEANVLFIALSHCEAPLEAPILRAIALRGAALTGVVISALCDDVAIVSDLRRRISHG